MDIGELREENRRLKALESIRQENAKSELEKRSLKKENFRLRNSGTISKVESAKKRIAAAFTRTSATAAPALMSLGRGAKKAGLGIKRYGEYINGPGPSKESYKKKSYLKKIGKNRYKKVSVKVKHNSPKKEIYGSDLGNSFMGGNSDMFRRSGFV